MDFDPTMLFLTLLFSLIGTAYFIYGKKQDEYAFLIAGGTLMLYPYFVSGVIPTILLGVILTAGPFLARKFGY